MLVFVVFVVSKAESFSSKRGDKYKHVARFGFAPLALYLTAVWLSLNVLQGDQLSYGLAALAFRTGLVMTGVYAFVVLFIIL